MTERVRRLLVRLHLRKPNTYEQEILAESPLAYWRLHDADPSPRLGWHGPGDHSLHPVSEIPPGVSGVDA
jgi:hypothetical protein